MTDLNRALEVCPLPAFLTGTSTEYIGDRPLPRVVRDRPILFVLGPRGAGKSLVASRFAGPRRMVLDTQGVQRAILERVRRGTWSDELRHESSLVLDGPVWLCGRPAVVGLLCELLALRAAAGRRTVVCQADSDGSISLLFEKLPIGRSATVALRFPSSRRARLRAAERICLDHGIPVRCAKGTASTEDWSYARVLERIRGPIFTI